MYFLILFTFQLFNIAIFMILLYIFRQPTPFDMICGQHTEGSKEPQGSRVFGDCDALMRAVMRNILPEDELEEWEGAREDRMLDYDKQRT